MGRKLSTVHARPDKDCPSMEQRRRLAVIGAYALSAKSVVTAW
jgi:hypothetical protein